MSASSMDLCSMKRPELSRLFVKNQTPMGGWFAPKAMARSEPSPNEDAAWQRSHSECPLHRLSAVRPVVNHARRPFAVRRLNVEPRIRSQSARADDTVSCLLEATARVIAE